MIDFPREENGKPVKTAHYIKIHDQGRKFEFEYLDDRYGLRYEKHLVFWNAKGDFCNIYTRKIAKGKISRLCLERIQRRSNWL